MHFVPSVCAYLNEINVPSGHRQNKKIVGSNPRQGVCFYVFRTYNAVGQNVGSKHCHFVHLKTNARNVFPNITSSL